MKARSIVIILSLLVAVASAHARASGSSGYDMQAKLVEQGGLPPQAVKEDMNVKSDIGPNVGASNPPKFHEKGFINQPLKSNVNVGVQRQGFLNQPNIGSFRTSAVRTQPTFGSTTVGGLGGLGTSPYRFGAGLGSVFRGFAAGATGYPYGTTLVTGAPAYGYGTTLVTGAPAYGYSNVAYPAYSTVQYPATTYATTAYPATELAYPGQTYAAEVAYPYPTTTTIAYPATTAVIPYGYGGRFSRFGYGRPWRRGPTTAGTLLESENIDMQQQQPAQPLMGGEQQSFEQPPQALGEQEQQPAAPAQPEQPQQPQQPSSDIIYSAPGIRIGGKAEVDAFRAEGEAKANAAQAAAGAGGASAPAAPPAAPAGPEANAPAASPS